jgi:ubiquinone/menaquinone biosynthesis C-methylase UbiE
MDQANADAIRAWDSILFEKFSRFKYVLTEGLGRHGLEAMHRHPPPMAASVIDLGCGFGDTTCALALRTGPHGRAVGVDASANFIATARADAAAAGCENAQFIVADVQSDQLAGPYDYAFSRFGTMFFASPVAALRNVRANMHKDGQFVSVVWRQREDNVWLHAAELRVRELIPSVQRGDQLTCGPGPFSMAGADMVSEQFRAAGFTHIGFERFDCEICIGRDLDEAVQFAMALGPAGEIMRLAGAEGERMQPEVAAALRELLERFASARGVFAPSSTWIITARPGQNPLV